MAGHALATGHLAAAQNTPAISIGNKPEIRGIVHGFFDDQSGARLGRLRIDRVSVEPRREGFLRIGWKPLVVFDGVTLEISEGATWPATGLKILEALQGGARDGCILRNVHLQIAGPEARELRAPAGRLRANGALELSLAPVSGAAPPPAGAPPMCFWLIGPQAGQLVAVAPAAAAARARPADAAKKSQQID